MEICVHIKEGYTIHGETEQLLIVHVKNILKNGGVMKEDILQNLSEIYFYHCYKCGQSNLSRDEIHQVEGVKYICLECERKEDGGKK